MQVLREQELLPERVLRQVPELRREQVLQQVPEPELLHKRE